MPHAVDVADADAEVEEEAQAAVAVPPSDPAPVVSITSSSGKRKVVRPEYHTGTDVHAGVRSMSSGPCRFQSERLFGVA